MKALGFEEQEITTMVEVLNELLAGLQVHAQKLRNFHWNVKGDDFFEIHQITDQEYAKVDEEIDQVAERIRVLGATPISTFEEYIKTSSIAEVGTELSAKEMVEEILEDYEILFSLMIEVIDQAGDMGDVSSNNLIVRFQERREKMYWMLNAFLGK